MANTLITTSLVTKIAVREFINAMVLSAKVDRQLDSSFRKVGDTISVRKPVYFEATDGATLGTAEDVTEGSVSVQLDKRKHVHFEFTLRIVTGKLESS